MRGRSSTGYRLTPKIKAIEAEFDMPFPQVLAGFAADGCNRALTADILGFDRASFYRKLEGLKRAGVTIAWPCPYATRETPAYERTAAQQASAMANLAKRDPANAKPWGNETKATHEVLLRALKLREDNQWSWRQVAFHVGIDQSTLRRAMRKHKLTDPLGDTLVKQAQHQFTQFEVTRRPNETQRISGAAQVAADHVHHAVQQHRPDASLGPDPAYPRRGRRCTPDGAQPAA